MTAAVLLAALLAVARAPSAAPDTIQLAAARALLSRVIPHDTARFRLALIPADSGRDVFEVASEDGRIALRGSSGVAIASALDWYLEHVAGINVSVPLQPLLLPATLPPLPRSVHVVTPYRYRYFFNYCTFSYSMAWWGWPEWQRMIDWMALKGINLPLAVTGQEATWQLTLRDMGFTDKEIDEFLVGPAYLPWGWMGNIDGLGGPLPQSWIDSHVALEREILARERALGMMPVLQGFTGHVPASITRVFPEADVHRTGDWSAGFPGTWYLDPTDTLFQGIGRRFIERQTELFGTSHFYAADPFNEINPPTDDSTFLAGVGRSIYGAMHAVDPSAVWVLQGWFLYYAAKFWKAPQAQALLGAVPDDRLLVLDLYGDRHPVWRERDAFYGKPWVWNVLYNFGGKVSLNGNLPRIATNLQSALSSADHGKLWGLGMTMEGLGYNAVVPDYVLDMVWRDSVPAVDGWAHDWVTRRYHGFDAHAWNAWKILLATAYRSAPQTGTFLAERPQFYDAAMAYRSEPTPPYDPHELVAALDTLLAAAPALDTADAYRYDVVNLTRQVLGGLGLPFVDSVQAAYDRKDRAALLVAERRVEELLRDLDRLVGTRREFLLGTWLDQAKAWGTTPAERNLYEWNARNIITLWGEKCTEGQNDDLNLYAFKEWEGMFTGYFLPRWQAFFKALNAALASGAPFDRKPFAAASCEWEKAWSHGHGSFPAHPSGDALEVSRALFRKYRAFLPAN